MMLKQISVGTLLLVVASLAGCGSGDETASYKLVSVSGTVTLNGKPLGGAQIAFTPDPSNSQQTPGGDVSGPEGNYKAMFRGRSGLAPGKYKVTVTKNPEPAATSPAMENDPGMQQVFMETSSAAAGKARTKAKPAEKVESVFDREVPPGGGTIDMDVKASTKG